MSKAFTREDDAGGATELPERIISSQPNLVTAEGLAAIDAEIEEHSRRQTEANAGEDRDAAARAARELRYWTVRRASAQLMPAPPDNSEVRFGSTVAIEREDGRRSTWRIVGEDEADPAKGTVSYIAPLARALMGRRVGDVVKAGATDAEIVSISV
ncbi:MAG TPA: transcription elongation factor GreA [Hyphomonadaceae bacterium]|nr:transcription elongation factor GreA [Hyphomonadaceae bacterium]